MGNCPSSKPIFMTCDKFPYISYFLVKTTYRGVFMKRKFLTTMVAAGILLNHSQVSAHELTYKVKQGDTLWQISQNHQMSVSELKMYNQLTSDTIQIGQVLRLTAPDVVVSTLPKEAKLLNIEELIAEAKKYLGVPYVWGGESPSGFDCSGFLLYVFQKQNIDISRTVATIWNRTKPVSTPKRGDIVFFETYKKGPSHAGIYLGNQKFIHAGSSKGVTISDMNHTYWKERYLGAKRAY